MRKLIIPLFLTTSTAFTHAAIIVDGVVDVDYGAPLAVQTVQTQFGDNTDPTGLGGGGELDAAYARVQGGRLYITLTGNIERNFNKVSIFIDSRAGGENVLAVQNYDFANLANNLAGMTFDNGFTADYHLFGRWGGGAFELDFVDRMGGTDPNTFGLVTGTAANGAGTGIQSGSLTGAPLTGNLDFGFNNTNIAGVAGGTAAANQANAAAVTTGLELAIDLADIGSPTGDIRITAAYGNGDNNFFSNQFLGGLPANTGNLGGDGAGNFTGTSSGINLNNFAGDQFFTVTVPEPTSLVLTALGGLALTLRRKRQG